MSKKRDLNKEKKFHELLKAQNITLYKLLYEIEKGKSSKPRTKKNKS